MLQIHTTGDRFGSYTLLNRTYRKGHTTYAKFKCDCGAVLERSMGVITSGTVTKCRKCANAHKPNRIQQYGTACSVLRYHGVTDYDELSVYIGKLRDAGFDESYSVRRIDLNLPFAPDNFYAVAISKFSKRESTYGNVTLQECNGKPKFVASIGRGATKKTRHFSVARYGLIEAQVLAHQTRLQWERDNIAENRALAVSQGLLDY